MLIDAAKSLLDIPMLYESKQWLVGAPRCQQIFMDKYVRPNPGDRMLDLGCGTGAAVFYLPDNIDYTGVDISAAYIQRAKEKHDPKRKFLVADITTSQEPAGPFDCSMSFGVLHHISDDGVKRVLDRVATLVKPGGRYATIDPCIVEGQHPIARLLVTNDRGQHVRTVEEMRKVREAHGKTEITVASDMLNVPFTFIICVTTF